jgi:hypothetical protein
MYRGDRRIAPYFYLPTDPEFDSLEFRKRARWSDSLIAILDTATLHVLIDPKLDTVSFAELEDVKQELSRQAASFKNGELDSFLAVLQGLDFITSDADSLVISSLTSKYPYVILNKVDDPKDEVRKAGFITFSRVFFSPSRSYGVLFTSYICGRLCGNGRVLFFRRIGGKWSLIHQIDTWVS